MRFSRSLYPFIMPFLRFRRSVQGFRSYIDAVWPSECSGLDEEFFKKLRVFERFKDRSFKPLGHVNVLFGSVIEPS